MASRLILLACVQALYLQNANTQAILSNCGCQSQVTVTESCVQNPFNLPCQPVVQPIVAPGCQPVFVQPAVPCELEYFGSYNVPTATIIQDDSIANDLANTLQLLIVSNLLGNTLPFNNPGVLLGQPGVLAQPNLIAQPGFLAPGLPLASPVLQVAPLGLPALVGGCGCGCGCGCGLNYML